MNQYEDSKFNITQETNPDIIYLDDKERTNTNNEDKKQKIATLKMAQVVNQGACTNHFQKNSIKR